MYKKRHLLLPSSSRLSTQVNFIQLFQFCYAANNLHFSIVESDAIYFTLTLQIVSILKVWPKVRRTSVFRQTESNKLNSNAHFTLFTKIIKTFQPFLRITWHSSTDTTIRYHPKTHRASIERMENILWWPSSTINVAAANIPNSLTVNNKILMFIVWFCSQFNSSDSGRITHLTFSFYQYKSSSHLFSQSVRQSFGIILMM